MASNRRSAKWSQRATVWARPPRVGEWVGGTDRILGTVGEPGVCSRIVRPGHRTVGEPGACSRIVRPGHRTVGEQVRRSRVVAFVGQHVEPPVRVPGRVVRAGHSVHLTPCQRATAGGVGGAQARKNTACLVCPSCVFWWLERVQSVE